jgi:hypothetical protein
VIADSQFSKQIICTKAIVTHRDYGVGTWKPAEVLLPLCRFGLRAFSTSDMRRGQSLVVWAIRVGRQCARAVDEWLMVQTNLSR